MPPDFIGIVADAFRSGGIAVTLRDLISLTADPAGTLEATRAVVEECDRLGLELVPGLTDGDLDSERSLRPKVSGDQASALMDDEIRRGEGASVEFKSSLLYDRRRAAAAPGTPVADLRSESVLESSLKAICGLVNGDGGVLLIGVQDGGSICGIDDDFLFTSPNGTASERKDKWELHCRAVIRTRFYEGSRINDKIRMSLIDRDGKTVARLEVAKGRKLVAVKIQGTFGVYLRRGNSTERLECYEIEDVVRERMEGSGLAGR